MIVFSIIQRFFRESLVCTIKTNCVFTLYRKFNIFYNQVLKKWTFSCLLCLSLLNLNFKVMYQKLQLLKNPYLCIILFLGDFRQIFLIVTRGTCDEIIAPLERSYLWPYVSKCEVKTNMSVSLPVPEKPRFA